MYFDVSRGPAHIQTCCTQIGACGTEYDLVTCPNMITVTVNFREKGAPELKTDIFHTSERMTKQYSHLRTRNSWTSWRQVSIHTNTLGNWELPHPSRSSFPSMPNNCSQAEGYLRNFVKTFKCKPDLKAQCLEFMEKVISKGHTSLVPREELHVPSGNFFYLSHLPIFHPKKGSLRVVFDSSLEFESVYLSKSLIAGPVQMSSLVEVIMSLRKENVAVI